MAQINRESIKAKLDSCTKSAQKEKKFEINDKSVEQIAQVFMKTLCAQVKSMRAHGSTDYRRQLENGKLGKTAVDAATNLKYVGYSFSASGDVVYVDINFDGDLHRDSLIPPHGSGRRAGKGVDNIVAMLNNGYALPSRKSVYGYWKNHGYTKSIPVRTGSNFVGKAVDEFMKSHAKKYGVKKIIVNDLYKTDT